MGHKIFKAFINSLFILYIVAFISANSTFAYSVPTFPSCLSTQGTLKVRHNDGPHGIVGDSKTYYGVDSVYTLSDSTLMQCLCETNGNGIQTNWWKINELSDQDINRLKLDGWTYISNGAAWGLEDAPYLAKNISYSCVGGAGGSNSGSNSSSSSNSNSSGSVESVSAAVNKMGDILGLASTGNITTVLFYFAVGVTLIGIAFVIRSKKTI